MLETTLLRKCILSHSVLQTHKWSFHAPSFLENVCASLRNVVCFDRYDGGGFGCCSGALLGQHRVCLVTCPFSGQTLFDVMLQYFETLHKNTLHTNTRTHTPPPPHPPTNPPPTHRTHARSHASTRASTNARARARERERDRETERQRQRDRDRETERQRDRDTEIQSDRETERQRDRETAQRHVKLHASLLAPVLHACTLLQALSLLRLH